jgi:hypothetical protein
MELSVSRPKLHTGQKIVYDNKKRFNVLRNGRRWGKTILSVRLAIDTILQGGKVGYFVPSYNFCDEFWDEIKDRLESIITYKNESKYRITFKTGGSVQIFSLEKKRAGRGKKFHRAIIDEVAFVKDMETSWNKAIRPTLADYAGDAFFMSTPDGFNNYFHTLDENSKKFEDWQSFHMPTTSNPFILESEIEEIKSQIDSLTYQQEFEAEYINFTGNAFAYAFNDTKHISNEAEYLEGGTIYLSFDFNVDPMTCSVFQHTADFIYQIDEFRLSTSDIYELLGQIKAKYCDRGNPIKVTGDASGWAREKSTKGLVCMYDIIQKELDISFNNIDAPRSNPSHKNNRVLVNSILEKHKNVKINPKCKGTIKDLMYVQVDAFGNIDKSNMELTHNLDNFRYYLNSYHSQFCRLI